jgi:hypothetical protein
MSRRTEWSCRADGSLGLIGPTMLCVLWTSRDGSLAPRLRSPRAWDPVAVREVAGPSGEVRPRLSARLAQERQLRRVRARRTDAHRFRILPQRSAWIHDATGGRGRAAVSGRGRDSSGWVRCCHCPTGWVARCPRRGLAAGYGGDVIGVRWVQIVLQKDDGVDDQAARVELPVRPYRATASRAISGRTSVSAGRRSRRAGCTPAC